MCTGAKIRQVTWRHPGRETKLALTMRVVNGGEDLATRRRQNGHDGSAV
jgi:hypothetical protein